MEFNSQICTNIEQSERLIALGLKKETADMSISTRSFDTDNEIKYSLIPYSECKYRIMYNVIPAWSLHRLLAIADMHAMNPVSKMENWYDDLIAHIQSCIHLGYISKEYLNMDIVELRKKENMELLKNGGK